MSKLIADDPLAETDLILSETFYGSSRAKPHRMAAGTQSPATTPAKPKPTHYKIVCISLYTDDIERLEGLVAELKRKGHT
jgi:hypothetical protein